MSGGPFPASAPVPVGLGAQFKRQLPRFSAGLVLLGAYQFCQYLFDTRLAKAINAAVEQRHDVASRIGFILVGVAVAALVIRVLSRVLIFNGGRIVEYELRKAVLDRLHALGPSFYRRMSTGDIMSRATNDLLQVRLLLGFGVLTAINTVFAFISALAVTLAISVKLTLASLATMPILVVVMRQFGKLMFSRQKANQEALGTMSSAVQSSIAGVRVIRSYALEAEEARRFGLENRSYLERSLALARLRGLMFPVMQSITAFGVVVVLLYGGSLMLEGEIVAGDFIAFYRALTRLTWPLISLGFLVSLIQRGRASYERLAEIFDAKPDVRDGQTGLPAEAPGALSVRDLSFSYDGVHPVLQDISFDLLPGQSLAIVGRTGSGKSTLGVLLARLQPTPEGTVFLDGVDVCDLALSELRRTIVYAQQSPFLFSTTVGRNIGYVLSDPDSESALGTVQRAAGEAHIRTEIEDLPDGFDTVVGERGVQLSGGQKQRTALARGLVSSPKILVLDDPLSAVDAKTEDAILDAIDRQRSERAVILITHRVRAAARCDRVVVVDNGRIIEEGTHEELVAHGGLYAAFAEEQRIESELARLGAEAPSDSREAAPA